MKIHMIASSAAVVAFGAALLAPAAAQATPAVPTATSGSTLIRVANLEGTGVIMPTGSNMRFGDGYQRVEYPEGGTWQYGTTHGTYSNFKHGTRLHGATAKNGEGNSDRKTRVPGGSWAKTEIKKTFTDNQAYYHFN
jgi:lactococcin 972 family bacteriocin